MVMIGGSLQEIVPRMQRDTERARWPRGHELAAMPAPVQDAAEAEGSGSAWPRPSSEPDAAAHQNVRPPVNPGRHAG